MLFYPCTLNKYEIGVISIILFALLYLAFGKKISGDNFQTRYIEKYYDEIENKNIVQINNPLNLNILIDTDNSKRLVEKDNTSGIYSLKTIYFLKISDHTTAYNEYKIGEVLVNELKCRYTYFNNIWYINKEDKIKCSKDEAFNEINKIIPNINEFLQSKTDKLSTWKNKD